MSRIQKQLRSFWHDASSLWKLATKANYDAVQVRDKFFITVFAMWLARRRGLKFFYWLSFPYPEDDLLRASRGQSRADTLVSLRGRLCGWLLYRYILPRSDYAFVQSELMKTEVCARGGIPSRTMPVPMGVNMTELPVDAGVVPRTDGQFVLGYLGALDAVRQLGILVEMLAELRCAGAKVKLLLIGDASISKDRRALEELAEKLQVADSMEITGFMPRVEALKRIREADACISPIVPSPIFRVGSPTKMVEYMGAGTPVIANDHPEQQWILRESRAGICVPWRVRHFARAVRWMMALSAEQRREMGARGREWVISNRTYERIADTVEQKYLELLATST